MKKLNTIQKRNKLNNVFIGDEKGNGGANHQYNIVGGTIDENGLGDFQDIIMFQNVARNDPSSIDGVLDVDLLEIVRHRLQCFQEGEFATMENDVALYHIETALLWLNKRTEDRAERNVLGTMQK